MGFSRAELESFRGATVPDLLGERVKLVFVGINPGLWTAAAGSHFARPGNRFYPALFRAGLVDRLIDASRGLSASDRAHLEDQGIGITNLVARATARADELSSAELMTGGLRLRHFVTTTRSAVIAVAGITAYRTAFGERTAKVGRQPAGLSGAQLWVVPNPSGLNAHETIDSLAAAYAEVGVAAGIFGRSRD